MYHLRFEIGHLTLVIGLERLIVLFRTIMNVRKEMS